MRALARRRWQERDQPIRKPRKADGRPPPHDLETERAVIYCALNDPGAAEVASAALSPDDFYDINHGRVFEAIQELTKAHRPVDRVTVLAWLNDRDWKIDGGWQPFVWRLHISHVEAVPKYVDRYTKAVGAKARRRRMIGACQRFAEEGYFDVGDDDAWNTHVAETMSDNAQSAVQSQAESVGEIIKESFAKLTAMHDSGKRMDGYRTGYDRLDAKTAGLHDGDLIIVAARPGMGKTSLVMNMAVNMASPKTVSEGGRERFEPGMGVCVFSLEMPREQLATRMVCSEGRVDLGRLRQGFLHAEDWRKLTDAATYLQQLPIWIDDTPALGILELRAKVRRRQALYNRPAEGNKPEQRVGLVAVDYLQLMSGDADSREQEISEISRGLKALAKELRVPVIALSQLNRAVETRGKDKRPQLSDLRESGAIEQDADTIIFIYRDDYYNPETSDLKGIAELIIAKQRNGPTGKVKVRFSASCTRFDNLEPSDYPESPEDD